MADQPRVGAFLLIFAIFLIIAFDLPNVEAHLADLAADVAGIIERAAEDMRGWIA